MQAILATLSLGPVGISDGINQTDVSLIGQAFRSSEDSTLLRPSRPLSTVDSVFTNQSTVTVHHAAATPDVAGANPPGTCSLGCNNEPPADCAKCRDALPYQCLESDPRYPQECQYAFHDACSKLGGKCGGGGGAGAAFGCDDGKPAYQNGKFNPEKQWQKCEISPGELYGKCVPWGCQPPNSTDSDYFAPSTHAADVGHAIKSGSAADIRATHASLEHGPNSHYVVSWMATNEVTLQSTDLYPQPPLGTKLAVRKHVISPAGAAQSAGCTSGNWCRQGVACTPPRIRVIFCEWSLRKGRRSGWGEGGRSP